MFSCKKTPAKLCRCFLVFSLFSASHYIITDKGLVILFDHAMLKEGFMTLYLSIT